MKGCIRVLVVLSLHLLATVSLVELVRARPGDNTIPRSSNHRLAAASDSSDSQPPWNPSSQIDEDGFLKESYWRLPGEWEKEADIGGKHGPRSRRSKHFPEIPVTIRQVPGDGNCLFHSISTCLAFVTNGTHVSMKDTERLREASACLRQQAVECLERSPRRVLYLQGNEYLRARDLVDAAAAQYDISGERYCELMKKESYWGGGPEIVALCNVLRRPIHVYELTTHPAKNNHKAQQFRLRRMACFGSPKFDRREPLHILSADSRFPDVAPGKQLASGNHFLAMFPATPTVGKSRVIRGGGSLRRKRPDNEENELEEANKQARRLKDAADTVASSRDGFLESLTAFLHKFSTKWLPDRGI